MTFDEKLREALHTFVDRVVSNREQYAEGGVDTYLEIEAQAISATKQAIAEKMPGKKKEGMSQFGDHFNDGWNDCLDHIKKQLRLEK